MPPLLASMLHLGPRQMALYGLYQFGLRSGHYRRVTPVGGLPLAETPPLDLRAGPYTIPRAEWLREILGASAGALLLEADEIVEGRLRLFGSEAAPAVWSLPGPLRHWTLSEGDKAHWLHGQDIKFTWEPGRFSWVYPLGRAFALTGDERYPAAFWRHTSAFLAANPPNLGPHWASAQEVALRLLGLVYAGQVFAGSAAAGAWAERLPRAIVEHARRIPPTLVYARAQNNNHLLSEALGLYAAGLIFPGWSEARAWRETGWKWLNAALQTQIAPDGVYVQQSTNYHRLMLHVALTFNSLANRAGQALPPLTRRRLAAAVIWLAGHTDPASGEMTNLGANDGANILPLAQAAFRDARPVLQAAGRAFFGRPLLSPGPWDELGQWVGEQSSVAGDGLPAISNQSSLAGDRSSIVADQLSDDAGRPGSVGGEIRLGQQFPRSPQSSDQSDPLQSSISDPQPSISWSSLRAAWFTSRPSHADQLHVELWWRGMNLARDAGTYLYNAPPPWDNALSATAVHNTVVVDDKDQMRRGGRFLWLDWAQASLVELDETLDGSRGLAAVAAVHDGYRKLGVLHRRCLAQIDDRTWQVTDNLLPLKPGHALEHTARVHWLLPDWPWALEGAGLHLESPAGPLRLDLSAGGSGEIAPRVGLFRAGEKLAGRYPGSALLGWYSPTYGVREAALSFTADITGPLPLRLISRWSLPGDTPWR